ncbi:MAG: alkaline phosphatase family protein [Planctomycetota bacterium]|jgi:predicted AlkP superfamily phosphohydrolase/phosphomutase
MRNIYNCLKKDLILKSICIILYLFFINVSCTGSSALAAKKMLLLGFDGMDPVLLDMYMSEGILPNFKLLKERGNFKPLITSMPPQSPVAWSNFITGMNPGGHGIFDFIAREPETYMPYLSTSKTTEAKRTVKLGNWLIPFSKAETFLLRKGKAFWEILQEEGIPSTVLKVPANFPPVKSEAKTLSGMGTPDILGTYGTFSFYTTKDMEDEEKEIESGKLFSVKMLNNTIKTQLTGPPNPFKVSGESVSTDLIISVDEHNPVALIRIDEEEILLNEGEWSEWVKVSFKLAPFQTLTGICRFYVMKVHPYFELYVSPINIDPTNPNIPISTPADYAEEIANEIGYFYTQGMPEDTKALDQGFINNDAYIEQSDFIFHERQKLLNLEMERFSTGLLFVYFSTTDLVSHMFWRYMDKEHPGYKSEEAEKYSDVIKRTYKKMDTLLGDVIKRIDSNTTLVVLSDHGFGPFRRQFHMNRWLKENGYLSFADESLEESGEFFENVNFRKTRAYAFGFNGIYINLSGREGNGIVTPGDEKEQLIDNIIKELENIRDPENNKKVVNKVYRREEIYSGKYVADAPDILIGYNRGYRSSWETALGKVPKGLYGDNMKRWSGTHLWDYKLVPGIVLSNKKIVKKDPALIDIAPTILAEFGIEKNNDMIGEPIF